MKYESSLLMNALGGIYNASIPFILVACKCDFPPAHRHVDPAGVEKRAKALIGDITAFQTSQATPDSQKRCVAVLLRAIVSMRNRKWQLFPLNSPTLRLLPALLALFLETRRSHATTPLYHFYFKMCNFPFFLTYYYRASTPCRCSTTSQFVSCWKSIPAPPSIAQT
jgi:hypothetical protein